MRISPFLPGELEGKVDPTRYGFEVIREESPSGEEAAARVRHFYENAKARTGVVIPSLERYLKSTEAKHGHKRRRP